MGKFSNFNVDQELLDDIMKAKENNGTGNYQGVEAGQYKNCRVEKLELGTTKDGRPMLRAMLRIPEQGKKGRCVFFNRVLYGTKNDVNMIASALGWLESLAPSEDIDITFHDYDQLDELIMDIAEDIQELEYDITYDPDAFNSIHIDEVYDNA